MAPHFGFGLDCVIDFDQWHYSQFQAQALKYPSLYHGHERSVPQLASQLKENEKQVECSYMTNLQTYTLEQH